jgi:RNA polymerase sigma-70 factor (ECF subfamily)
MNDTSQKIDAAYSLDALKAGDRLEFARLVDDYSGRIYRLVRRILTDDQDVEDVLQETFIKVYQKIATFEGRSQLATWIYRIAMNKALTVLRKKDPEAVSLEQGFEMDDESGDSIPMEIVDWCCLPESELLSVEARRHIDSAIHQLSPALQAVFLLRDVEGLSVRETAEALNLSEPAVKVRLLRARLALREKLSAYYGGRVKEMKEV